MIKHVRTGKSLDRPFSLVEENIIETNGKILLKNENVFQDILGFGAAFTESAAFTYSKMSEKNKKLIIDKYFGEEGLNYTIGRVHIHSCDFSLENYTYVDENDVELNTFDISREKKWVLPFIKDAETAKGTKLSFLASPWSPPAWMKNTNEMNHGGKLLDKYKQSWANYYVKFVDEMHKVGVDIFGITVQNEPAAVQVWDSCIYTAEEERDFVKDYLGPTFEKSEYSDTKIIIWDHNRDIIFDRAKTVLEDKTANKYVWGTGLHWYVSEEFENLSKVHDLFPDKHILFTEGCIEGGVHLGAWHTGERYARNMIGDFNNYCEGYIDWNIILDEMGGPNHVGNYCDAPIICDTKNDQVHINSSYYYIGHFSKYVQPGAKRIGHTNDLNEIKTVSFKNPNGEIVTIILNETENDIFIDVVNGESNHSMKSMKRSISTLIWKE